MFSNYKDTIDLSSDYSSTDDEVKIVELSARKAFKYTRNSPPIAFSENEPTEKKDAFETTGQHVYGFDIFEVGSPRKKQKVDLPDVPLIEGMCCILYVRFFTIMI